MTSDRSADRHAPGRQAGISARLDRADFDALETCRKTLGITRRQAMIAAIREWVTRKDADHLKTETTETGEQR